MRLLISALCTGALTLVLGCPPSGGQKPVPVNTNPPTPTPAPAETEQPAEPSEVEQQLGSIAPNDEEFMKSLEALKTAMEADVALAAAAKEEEAAAIQKLGVALEEEVDKRAEQEKQIATAIIEGLRQRGFHVIANIIDVPKPLPAAADALFKDLPVGQFSPVIEWHGGYGVVRKIKDSETALTVGYIYATKEHAAGPAAAMPAEGDAAPAEGDAAPAEGTAPGGTAPAGGGH